MKNRFFLLHLALLVALGSTWLRSQGDLNPPGAPAPTMKIEPRVPLVVGASGVATEANYEFVITEPGSYVLTKNLDVTKPNGIDVRSSHVTLDLRGFAIRRTAGSGGNGIEIDENTEQVRVSNGKIDGGIGEFEFAVVALTQNSNGGCYDRLHASNCSVIALWGGTQWTLKNCSAGPNPNGQGIRVAEGSTVVGCRAAGNSVAGFVSSDGTTVTNCASYNNGVGFSGGTVTYLNCNATANQGTGFICDIGSTVTSCTSRSNGGEGFLMRQATSITASSAVSNTLNGIRCETQAVQVLDCNASLNGLDGVLGANGSTIRNCTTRSNGGDGIEVPADCFVVGNNCTNNGTQTTNGSGVHVTGAGNRIESNVAILNKKGFWIEGAVNIVIRNTARYNPDGTPTNYDIAGNNAHGPIVDVTGVNDISALTDADHPWANFVH